MMKFKSTLWPARALAGLSFAFLFAGCATAPYQVSNDPKAIEKSCFEGASAACALLGQEITPKSPTSVLQGVTSNNQTRIAVLAPKKTYLSYFVRKAKDPKFRVLEAKREERGSSRLAVDQLEINELEPSVTYQLLIAGPDGMLWDMREFKSLDLKKKPVKVMLASCMDDGMTDIQKAMWPEVVKLKPDLMLWVGDNVYADKYLPKKAPASPEQLWDRYANTRNELEIFKIPQLIPTVALWDDHDMGANDGDRTYQYKNEAQEVFFAFFPQKNSAQNFDRGHGVGSWLEAFGVHFAFLDGRSFRSPNGSDENQTHFGIDQENWLKEKMKSAKSPVFLITGDQFYGGYHSFESYQGSQPKSFVEFVKEMRKFRYPILFLSGDRHLTEIIKVPKRDLGYATYELTSSAIHARVFPDSFKRNPSLNQLVGADGVYNFMMLEWGKVQPHEISFKATSYGEQGKVIYSRSLKVRH